MPQPYDYSLGVPSATESFLGGIQMAQQLRQQKLAAEAQQAKLDAAARAKQFAIDVAAVQKDPSPQALNDLYTRYGTDYGTELDAVSKRLDERDKRTYSTFLSRAIDAKSKGASAEQVAAIYQEGAIAAKNSGREDIAQKFDAASNMAKDPNLNDDFAARSLLHKFDPDGYKVLYENEEPFVINNGVAFLKGPLRRLANDTEKLMNGSMAAEQYDSIYGEGKAAKYIKTGSIDVAPAYHAPTQSDIDNAKAGKISADIFNRIFGPNAFNQYVGGQTSAPAPSGNFPRK